MNYFRREDVRDLPELFDHIPADRMIDEQKRQRFAAFLFAAQMHSRDVHLAPAKNGTDASDDAGLVVVGEEDHIAARHNFKRIAVDVHNARKFVGKYRSRYPMRFYVRLEFD